MQKNLIELRKSVESMSIEELTLFIWRAQWVSTARPNQLVPEGDWWTTWAVIAGRGFGKTRLGAEGLGSYAATNASTRCAVIAPTLNDVRAVCIEGESGLLKVIPKNLIESYNKSTLEIYFKNGSIIRGFGGDAFERLRGPQHHMVWCCIPGTLISMADGSFTPIEKVQIGEMVKTRYGSRKVIASGLSDNPNELVSIGCGVTSLTVTVDHPILVNDQWIPAGDIKVGDKLWVDTNKSERKTSDTSTELCTNSITGKFQKDGLFITLMKINKTTLLKIFKLCQGPSIKGFMRLVKPLLNCKRKERLNRLLLRVRQSKENAFNATWNLFHFQPANHLNFALQNALRNGAKTDLFQNTEHAKSAPRNILQSNDFSVTALRNAINDQLCEPIELKPTAVKNVVRSVNSPTYNLTVEGEHEFIANGIVVHNCDELGAWPYPDEAYSMMKFGLRLGTAPKVIVTTTPKPIDLVRKLVDEGLDDDSTTIVTTGSTYDNKVNLAPSFIEELLQYEGTQLGRQEIWAELIDPEEGGIVKRSWFKLWPADRPLPKFEYVVQSYDVATSDKTINDPTACVVFGVFRPSPDLPMSVMMIDCWDEHMQYPDLRPKVVEEYESIYGNEDEFGSGKKVDLILIEDKSAGISLIQDLQRAGLPVRGYNPGRADKAMRLNIVAPLIMRGRVYLPESLERKDQPRKWCETFVNQVCSFPNAKHDDYCDALSQALRILRDMGMISIDPQMQYDDTYDEDRPARVNPYAV